MLEKKISKASLGRVPFYLSYLKKGRRDDNISATIIAKDLNLGEVLVRKDLASLCGSGRPKTGYEREDLINKLESYLENDNGKTIVVGSGKLGNALLNFNGFLEYGIDIMAGFDVNNDKKIYQSNKPIYPMSELEDYIKNNNVKIAIITVPESAAQETFNSLYNYGIRLFSCFSKGKLDTPSDAIVQYENLALSLAHLKTK